MELKSKTKGCRIEMKDKQVFYSGVKRPQFDLDDHDLGADEQRDRLKNHERTHLGVRPFNCAFCSKSFSRTDHLKNHQRCHTGEKPFKCGVCQRDFSQMDSLRNHSRSHTGKRSFQCQKLLEAKDQPGQTLKEDGQIQCDSSSAAKVAKSGDGRQGAKVGGEQTQGGGGGVVKQVSLVIIEKTMEGKKCTTNVWNIAADKTPTTAPSTPSNKKKQIYKDISDTSNEVNMRQEATGCQNIGQDKQIDRKQCEPMKDLCPDDILQKQLSNTDYCSICDVECNSEVAMKEHLKGHKHKMRLLKNKKNIPATSPISFKEFVACPDRKSRLKPNLSVKPGSEKKLLLLGLAYITEFQQRNCSELPQYVCNLCECVCDVLSVTAHITGTKHRIRYINYHYPEYSTELHDLRLNCNTSTVSQAVTKIADVIQKKEGDQCIDVRVKIEPEATVSDKDKQSKKNAEVEQTLNSFETGHKSCHSGKEDSMPSEISDQTKQPDGEKDLPSFYQLMCPVANVLTRMPIMTEQEMLLGQEICRTIMMALQNKISDGENAAMTSRETSGSTSQ